MEPSELKTFKENFFQLQNQVRKDYGAPPLEWSAKLEENAQNWANEIAKFDSMMHDDDQNHSSENIAMVYGGVPTPEMVIEEWKNEGKEYDFTLNKFQERSSHFSLMVWINCTNFGLGVSKSDSDIYYVVARYSPCGNYFKLFKKNVLKKGSGMTKRTKPPVIPVLELPDDKTLKEYFLKFHNIARDKHNSPSVNWDEELTLQAKEAAEEIVKARSKDKPYPQPHQNVGRNLIFSLGGFPPLSEIMNLWYETRQNYDYESQEFQPKCGPFSQLVWKESKRIGAGIYESDNAYAIVCYYSPPGNVYGSYEENVSQPINRKKLDFNEI